MDNQHVQEIWQEYGAQLRGFLRKRVSNEEDAEDLARHFRSAIQRRRRGMVIVYQLDPVISGSNPATAYYLGSGLDPALSDRSMPGPIPSQDVATMLKKVLKYILLPETLKSQKKIFII